MPGGHANTSSAAQVLRAGGLVAFPTETVYGLGADATNPQAVARIFAVKRRPSFDPLIVHVPDFTFAHKVARFTDVAEALARAFWPGPLTLVLDKQQIVPDIVTSGLDTVGVRVPDHPLAHELLQLARVPVAAPSANRFGQVSPTTAQHVREQLGNEIDVVLDGGPCRVGVESTIVMVTAEGVKLLRPGGLAVEEIEKVVGPVTRGIPVHEREATASNPALAPGMLKSHYSPGPPLQLIAEGEYVEPSAQAALLAFKHPREGFAACEVLSARGALTEAAANLFGALRRLGSSGVSRIYAERIPERGLGLAIMDRLTRAAHPNGSQALEQDQFEANQPT